MITVDVLYTLKNSVTTACDRVSRICGSGQAVFIHYPSLDLAATLGAPRNMIGRQMLDAYWKQCNVLD